MAIKKKDRSVRQAQIGMENLFAGSSNEDIAKAQFKRWKWTAGKPAPDIGVDLVVEIPTRAEIQGAAFSAQVRSGKRWKATEKIKRASALRLKGSPLPAFMIFINQTTCQARWANLELLFDTERSFRNGGDLLVPLSESDAFTVGCAKPPSEFLDAIYHAKKRGAMKAAGDLSTLAHAIHDHYQQIDPSLVVRPSFDGKRNVLTIAARNKSVPMNIEIRELTNVSKAAFREAVEWGRPAKITAREFVLSGSPLWDYLSQEMHLTQFEFRPEPVWHGRAMLITHAGDQRRHTEIADAQLTRGTLGGECKLVLCRDLLELRIRIDSKLASTANVSIEYAVMNSWTMMELPAAACALKVLDGMLAGDMVELHLTDFDKSDIGPIKFRWGAALSDELHELTYPLRAAAALVQLVNEQSWRVEGFPFTKARRTDMGIWLSGQQLINDGRTVLPAFRFSMELSERPSIGDGEAAFGTLLLSHSLDVPLGGELLGQLPAWVRFRNYHIAIEPIGVGSAWRIHCTPGEGATREYLAPTDQPPSM